MKTLNDYFTTDRIVKYLCRIRAKQSKQRNKMHLLGAISSRTKFNRHDNCKQDDEFSEDQKLLQTILPPRRKWKKLTLKNRYEGTDRLDSVKVNEKSLIVTIKYYQQNHPNETFLIRLREFVKEIQAEVNGQCRLSAPQIVPKRKDENSRECRPISNFKLKDRIIIGLTNKYLSQLFDEYFYEHSYAFRMPKIEGEAKHEVTHHDAIRSIQSFLHMHGNCDLWVSECDIGKFFDSVHHSLVKKIFKKWSRKLSHSNSPIDKRAETLFYNYLKCYSFSKTVLPLNSDKNFWAKFKIEGGQFAWVKDELIKNGFYKRPWQCEIGVPQGGAISGLIANLALNEVDCIMSDKSDSKFHYVRFCDDMVILHVSESECRRKFADYSQGLAGLKLIAHRPISEPLSRENFWSPSIKSKAPYKWGKADPDCFKWISFVGYNIDIDGNLRVRKKSIEKEKDKQKKVVDEVIEASSRKRRKEDSYIIESCVNRLVGMSVGRISLKNFKTTKSEMCWAKGFVLLKDNQDLRRQMQSLDQCRQLQIRRLEKALKELKTDEGSKKRIVMENAFTCISDVSLDDSILIRKILSDCKVLDSDFSLQFPPNYYTCKDIDFLHLEQHRRDILRILEQWFKPRKVPYYGKPFSYYYHIIEKDR